MSKWRKPTRTKIGAITYQIKYVKPGKRGSLLLEEGQLGAIDQALHRIELDKDMSDQMMIMVLIHEILHGVGDAMSPNRGPFSKEGFTSTCTEFLVQALTEAHLLPTVEGGKYQKHLCILKRKN